MNRTALTFGAAAVISTSFLRVEATQPSFRSLPLVFEENRGQAPAGVRYLARGGSSALLISDRGALLNIAKDGKSASIRMTVPYAAASVQGERLLASRSNYFLSEDRSKWVTGAAHFEGVRLREIRPGVDLVFYSSESHLEYDFIVAPGRDPNAIALRFEGQQALSIDAGGDLVLETAAGELRHRKPRAWQESGGVRKDVEVRFALGEGGAVGFRTGAYDPRLPLVIDPVIVYSTFFPGIVYALTADAAGNAYVSGDASSLFAPTPGGLSRTGQVFVAKFNRSGQLVYATYFTSRIWNLWPDGAGNVYLSGYTFSADFPVTPGALKAARPGAYFLTKLSSDGSTLLSSATVGPIDFEVPFIVMAIDAAGNAYLGGRTQASAAIPATPGAYSTVIRGGYDTFVMKINAGATAILWSTYVGGVKDEEISGLAVDSAGNVYATGDTNSPDFPGTGTFPGVGAGDAFLYKLNSSGTQLIFSAVFGGASQDYGRRVAVDAAGAAYVAGTTQSANFPTTPGAPARTLSGSSDAFAAKFSPAGELIYSTFLGGSGYEFGIGIGVDGAGNAVIGGVTGSADFPVTPGSLVAGPDSAGQQLFVTRLNQAGSAIQYSTKFGGRDMILYGFAYAPDGAAYFAGFTPDLTLPVTPGAYWPTPAGVVGYYDIGYVLKVDLASPVTCPVPALSPASLSFPDAGGTGSVDVITADGCAWEATTDPGIAIAPPPSGVGRGRIVFTVPPGGPAAVFSIRLGAAAVTVTRRSSGCYAAVQPVALSFPAAGGHQPVTVTIPPDCPWRTQSSLPWLQLSPSSGTGGGTVEVYVQPSNFGARSGSVTIAGTTLAVSQAGGTCSLWVASPLANAPASGGPSGIPFFVTGSNCAWNAMSLAPWIHISTPSGTDSGILSFILDPNPGSQPRAGSIFFEGQTIAITQSGSGEPLRFVPVAGCRAVDTRLASGPLGGPALWGSARDFALQNSACGIPSTARAYLLNITAFPLGPVNFVAAWPAGQERPGTSTLNAPDGNVRSNIAVVAAGANGAVSVYASGRTHIAVDVSGYFVSASDPSGLAFYPLAPCRVADTRTSGGLTFVEPGQTRTISVLKSSCGVPASARVHSLNLTVFPVDFEASYITVWPSGSAQPGVPTAEAVFFYPAGGMSAAIVPGGPDGSLNVSPSARMNLAVDINGYFAPPDGTSNALSFYPAGPCRLMDTRNAVGPLGGPAFSGRRDVPVSGGACGLPAPAKAYLLNATVVPLSPLVSLTLWDGGAMPPLITLNTPQSVFTANMAIVPANNGSISAYASSTTQLVLDAGGYFAQ